MNIQIDVTAEDIKNGTRHSCYDCPVQIAISRALKGRCDVRVGDYYAMITGSNGVEHGVDLPDPVPSWIKHFDMFGWGDPFSFQISHEDLF